MVVRVWLGVAAVFCAGAALAAEKDQEVSTQELARQGFFQDFDELDLTSLLEGSDVSVSVAGRRSEPLQRAAGAVSLITADDIRAFGFRTLEDVLLTLPGFDVLTNSVGRPRVVARGIASGPRGSSEGVLILLNGHRLDEDLTGGATAVNLRIPVGGLHRIEVLRGGASALYGDGAAAAVINLITDGSERKSAFSVGVGLGSFGQHQATLDMSRKVTPDLWIGGFAEFADSGGAQLLIPTDSWTLRDLRDAPLPPISLAPGRTTDNIRSVETLYRVAWKDLRLLWHVKQETTGGFVGVMDTLGTRNQINNRQIVLDARYERKLRGGTLTAQLGFTSSKADELSEVVPPGYRRETPGAILTLPSIVTQTQLGSRRQSAEASYARPFGDEHDIQVGLSLERESTFDLSAESNLNFEFFLPVEPIGPLPGAVRDVARDLIGLWVQDVWRAPADLTVTAALRRDQLSDVGGQWSPRLAVVRPLRHNLTARAAYSRSFRAPSFRDLAFNLPSVHGNPDLDETTVTNLEASLAYREEDFQLSGTAYLAWVRDPVELAGRPSLSQPTTLINGGGANVKGLEIEARRVWGEHALFVSYALQDPRHPETGRRLPDVPLHMATLGGNFLVAGEISLSPTLLLRGSRRRAPEDSRPPAGSYALLNLTARRTLFSRRLEVRAALNNLLDTEYEHPSPYYGVPGDYPRPGRSLFLDAKYKF